MVGVNYLGETRKAERMFIADITAHGLDGEVSASSFSHFKYTEWVSSKSIGIDGETCRI